MMLNNSMKTIFLDNKYTKIYFSIIEKVKKTQYCGFTEKHHIVPEHFYSERTRSGSKGWLSGNPNDNENLVDIPAREHAICHLLLRKMVDKDKNSGCIYAAWRMVNIEDNNGNRYRVNSRIYAKLKEEMGSMLQGVCYEDRYGEDRSKEIKQKIGKKSIGRKPMLGKTHSSDTKNLMSKKKTGISTPKSATMKARLSITRKEMNLDFSGSKNPMYGKKQSKKTKDLISEANSGSKNGMFEKYKNVPDVKCTYCNKIGKDGPNFKRFHFENCKGKNNARL